MKKEIEQALSILIGQPLISANRALDLEMFDFGQKHQILTRQGKEKEVGEFTIHIQCTWRITRQTRILVASKDRWYPGDESKDIPDDFDWSLPGNRLDKRISAFFQNIREPLLVKSVRADKVGGFTLRFVNSFMLEVFPDNSSNDEYWRFFQLSRNTKHFVVAGSGIQEA